MLKFLKHNRGLIVFLFSILFFRTAIADWSPVPSSSMEPTIYPGDVLLINKTALGPALPFSAGRLFGIDEPQRGDIITFRSPAEPRTLVKRVIGMPGDRIRTAGVRVFINDEALPLVLAATSDAAGVVTGRETIDGVEHGVQFDTGRDVPQLADEFTIPADAYFVMGDFRNNSVDSRFFGVVPRDNVIGRTSRIAVSVAEERGFSQRFGSALDPVH